MKAGKLGRWEAGKKRTQFFPASRQPSFPALFTSLLFALAAPLFALSVPPAPTQWLTDRGGVVDAAQAQALNDKLASFEQRSGAQFIIYVFPTLEGEVLEDFTIRCAEQWKVGNKKYDNGLILFVFVKERKLRVEVGYGLEPTMTDSFSSDVIRNYIAPHFSTGDYAGGLNAAADAIIARIEKTAAPVPPVNGGGGARASAKPGGTDVIGILVLLFIFFFVILPMLRRGGGGCGGCLWPMFFMGGGGRGTTFGGGGWGGGGGGFGGFSGGGGGFGGGGASGGW